MPSRDYLQGAADALGRLEQIIEDGSKHPLPTVVSHRAEYRAQLAALPPPAPYCQACGNALDGGVAPESKQIGEGVSAQLNEFKPDPQPDWRGLVGMLGQSLQEIWDTEVNRLGLDTARRVHPMQEAALDNLRRAKGGR